MRKHSLFATLILLAGTGYGAGRLLSAATATQVTAAPAAAASAAAAPVGMAPDRAPAVSAQAPQERSAQPVVEAPPVEQPAPPVPMPPPAEQAAVPEPAQQPAAPAQEARAQVPPTSMGLPREPGVPELGDTPLPVAKGAPLPDAPKTFMPSPALGSDTPKVTVIVSSDFQCPVCRRVVEPVAALVREVPDVRVEFKQHALSSHRRAEPAAVASLAAHRQGKFWPYHDLLFQSQGALEDADLERHAEQVGLDMAQFRKDLADPAILAQVRAESKASELLGARGTPAFFINGKMQVGWGSYFGFKQMVLDEAGAADAAIKAGTPANKVVEARAKANHEAGDDFVKYFIRGLPPAAE